MIHGLGFMGRVRARSRAATKGHYTSRAAVALDRLID